ncbi:MAG: 4-hydroxy-tetrahydrodipicolinate reductase [Ruminococcaceae bacterium]|nr:4-hydroxy-tetrahydrodipicolinate reductase [Oscillospiraceae bacterium]
MLNILLSGALGRMGRAVAETVAAKDGMCICAGVDINSSAKGAYDFPIYEKLSDFSGKADVIIDFSHHSSCDGLCAYAKEHKIPLVISTTGHTEEELAVMRETAKSVPVFYSRNMSLGINLLIHLAKKAAETLGDTFDIEIIEKHHNRKLDAPSGTALMIADALQSSLPYEAEYVYDRHSVRRERSKTEIGIHAIRGGTIVGEHDVLFAGKDETITLSHAAASREVFAQGAIKAAAFVVGKPAALYNMDDIINGMEL